MTDFRSIAAVTATLEQVVQAAANRAVGQAAVSFGPPVAHNADDDPGVNICLFRVTPNAAMRNAHFPTRTSDGELSGRNRVALDLHFILSFYGDSDSFEPELLLGSVALALEEEPILSRGAIAAGIAAHSGVLQGADLADAPSTVKIDPDQISLDDFTKLWSVFFQVPYVLSASYICSHVIVESDTRGPPPFPVAQRGVFVAPMANFSLEGAGATKAGQGGIAWNGPLWITGKGLSRYGIAFAIDGREVPVEAEDTSDRAVRIALVPANFGNSDIPAGTHIVEARAPADPSGPAHLRQRSNVLAFALHPSITLANDALDITASAGTKRSGTIEVGFSPAVRARQKVALVVDSRDPAKPGGAVLGRDAVAADSPPADKVAFPFEELETGTYLVRAEVDGVPALVEIETDSNSPDYGQIVGPEMVLA